VAPQLGSQLSLLRTDGLVVEQLPLPSSSPFAGRPLGETRARNRTGASIVAVLRDCAAIASPDPEFGLRVGDLIAVVGTQAAVDELAAILDGSDHDPPGLS
jgi:TrkA domain protein